MKKQLLIGCGADRKKRIYYDTTAEWTEVVTLDINAAAKPDVVWDLTKVPLPFADNEFDEIHAYEVLEHAGQQGDYKLYFAQFSEFWRILEPNGSLVGTSPMWDSPWAWGDPSHSRIISRQTLTYLDQTQYESQVGVTSMTDFRTIYKADFRAVWLKEQDQVFSYVLRACKPSRYKPK